MTDELSDVGHFAASPGRLTITKLSQDPLVQERPLAHQASLKPSPPVEGSSVPFGLSSGEREELTAVMKEGPFVANGDLTNPTLSAIHKQFTINDYP